MKTLIAAGMLLALAIPAHAETRTCNGRVRIDVETSDQGLYGKGYKQFSVGECVVEDPMLQKRVLRTCPIGSHCRVEGDYAGDAAIATVTSVTREKSEPIKCKPVAMDGKGWIGVGGWKYASKSCAMGPRTH